MIVGRPWRTYMSREGGQRLFLTITHYIPLVALESIRKPMSRKVKILIALSCSLAPLTHAATVIVTDTFSGSGILQK